MIRAIIASPFAPMPIACAVLVYLAGEAYHFAKSPRGALKKPDQLRTRAELLAESSPAPTHQQPAAPASEEIVSKKGAILWSPIPLVITIVSPSAAAPHEFYCPPPPRAGLPVKTIAPSRESAAVFEYAIWSPDIAAVQAGSSSSAPRTHKVSPAPAPEPSGRAATTPVSRQEAMTMLSISVEQNTMAPKDLSIRCRTCGHLSNAAGTDRVLIIGVVTEDVVSQAGKILIRAGSKVAGIGRTDLDNGRLQSDGNWSIIDGDHELRLPAVMQDEVSGFEGVAGKETSLGPERGASYFFLADKTPFVLLLKGEAKMTEVKALQSLQ